MKIEKAQWTTDAKHVRLSMPLTKVDEQRRTVTGFASLDNIDSHDDIVVADASVRAFTRFRGNIREMHQPIEVTDVVALQILELGRIGRRRIEKHDIIER